MIKSPILKYIELFKSYDTPEEEDELESGVTRNPVTIDNINNKNIKKIIENLNSKYNHKNNNKNIYINFIERLNNGILLGRSQQDISSILNIRPNELILYKKKLDNIKNEYQQVIGILNNTNIENLNNLDKLKYINFISDIFYLQTNEFRNKIFLIFRNLKNNNVTPSQYNGMLTRYVNEINNNNPSNDNIFVVLNYFFYKKNEYLNISNVLSDSYAQYYMDSKNTYRLLIYSTQLSKLSGEHSFYMSNVNRISHENVDNRFSNISNFYRSQPFNFFVSNMGENVAYNQGYINNNNIFNNSTIATLNLINSPGHLKNIINPKFNIMGVGMYYKNNQNPEFYFTQLFASINI